MVANFVLAYVGTMHTKKFLLNNLNWKINVSNYFSDCKLMKT